MKNSNKLNKYTKAVRVDKFVLIKKWKNEAIEKENV